MIEIEASTSSKSDVFISTLRRGDLDDCWKRWRTELGCPFAISFHPGWLNVLAEALGHEIFVLESSSGGRVTGILPLAYMHSAVFGRFLVSLPYLNTGGIVASDEATARLLIDRAVNLADDLDVRYLELRHETKLEHPSLKRELSSKVHMRLGLPESADDLLASFRSKLRSQVKKGEKYEFNVVFGRHELLRAFYRVFCRNMRDLGTPVFTMRLFAKILDYFPEAAELCVVRLGQIPVAAALLVHGFGSTEIPSASSLRDFNSTNANMVMYWHLLQRAIARGQKTFDFGRSTRESNTYRFKEQWGAMPYPAIWQYYVRQGDVGDMRPENVRYQRAIRMWQRLPVWLTRLVGPSIVRGIP